MYPFDQNNQQTYQQYAQANDSGDYSGIDPNEAAGHVQQFMQNAPPEMQQQVYQQHFEQMPMDPNNPQMMAQGFQQMGQQQPGMLQSLMGSGGGLGGMLGGGGASGGGLGGLMGGGGGMAGGGMMGLAGLVAKHMLGGQGGGL